MHRVFLIAMCLTLAAAFGCSEPSGASSEPTTPLDVRETGDWGLEPEGLETAGESTDGTVEADADLRLSSPDASDGLSPRDVITPRSDAANSDVFPVPDASTAEDANSSPDTSAPLDVAPEAIDTDPPEDSVSTTAMEVLFIGNSYTSANNLASLVANLATAAEVPMTTSAIVKGGAWLEHHADTPDTMTTIATGGWTHVVLQEQSYLAVPWPLTFLNAAAILSDAIHAAGATPVFFETWARAEGSSLYNEDLAGYNPITMQAALKAVYLQAANDNQGVYAPVGDAWEDSLASHPETALHTGDKSHPAPTGSYLAACVFLEVLSGQNPEETSWAPEGMPPEISESLRATAHAAVTEANAPEVD